MNCPKCSKAGVWVEDEPGVSWLRCTCGLMKMVERQNGQYVVKMGVGLSEVALPRVDTKDWEVLMAVASCEDGSTEEVSEMVGLSTDRVWAILRVLEVSRLVDMVTYGRGRPGGSTWAISRRAKLMIGV